MGFPSVRMRRLRGSSSVRRMVGTTSVSPDDLVMPLFVTSERDAETPMEQIPGAKLLSGAPLAGEARRLASLGIPAVLLFGMPLAEAKDSSGSAAFDDDGPAQKAVRTIKDAAPDMLVITDLCLCEFTDHGHCGLLKSGKIDNDLTLDCIQLAALSQARAGADIVAPSGMMDGSVAAIRRALDSNGFQDTLVMPYSAKFASGFYGPFKAATDSSPGESLHSTHQLDTGSFRQAMKEIELDIEEGADVVIVKPALPSLDIIHAARREFAVPIAAYQVSGFYHMICRRYEGDQLHRLMMEILTCIKRAGADIIITYHAGEAAKGTIRR